MSGGVYVGNPIRFDDLPVMVVSVTSILMYFFVGRTFYLFL